MHDNLIQAKYLFEKAKLVWEPYREITNGLTVGLLQDSAELVLWATAKKYGVGKDKESFTGLIGELGKAGKTVHYKHQITEVNNSRVQYKHYGLAPSASDVPKLIEGTALFLYENVREHFGLDFDSISLADDVVDDEIRSFLKSSERYRDDGDFEEALIQVSLAIQRTEALALNAQFGAFPRFENAYALFPENSQDDARILICEIASFFERFSANFAMLALKVDRSLYEELERRRLTVNVSEKGSRLGVTKHEKSAANLENVNFLISNVTEIARRL